MYPILLDMRERLVVVVGGGIVAARKVAELHRVGAEILVIAPELHPDIEALRGKIDIRQTVYLSGMLITMEQDDDLPFMVFAATDSPEVNAQVADEARSLDILVNVVDGTGDFSNMATIRRGDITIALSTGGASPALAAHLRERLEGMVGEEYATLTRWMGDNRARVKAALDPESRRELWRTIIDSPVLQNLRDGDEAAARQIFDRMIEEATQA